MKTLVGLVAATVICGAVPGVRAEAGPRATPLLDYALELHYDTMPDEAAFRERLSRASRELDRHPPPPQDCARTLGAARYAAMLNDLGIARSALGDNAGAADAQSAALACAPRAAHLHRDLAVDLMRLGRRPEARDVALRGLAIEPEDPDLTNVVMQLDFIEERWPAAIEGLRTLLRLEEDPEHALYWQCFLWLAQYRAGVLSPELAPGELPEGWPRPVLETLAGRSSEEALLAIVKDEPDDRRRREILSEALYYLGQKRLAEGDTDGARRYFAATVRLKVLYFAEHHLALAELDKLRGDGHAGSDT